MGAVGVMDKLLLYKALKNKSGAEISASGNPITLSGTLADNPLKDCKIYGWSKQDGDPTPENPVEIESAGMKMSTGKNLFTGFVFGGTSSRVENGIITTKEGASYIRSDYIPCEVGKHYVYNIPKGWRGSQTVFCNSDKKYIGTPKTPQSFNVPEDTAYFVFQIAKTDTTAIYQADLDAVSKLVQVEQADACTEYEPYTGGVPKLHGDKIDLEVHSKNLLNITIESKCDKTGASSTKRIILPGEYILGLTYTNICANYLNNVFISQERISFFSNGVGYGIGIGVIAEKGKKYVISGEYKNGDMRMVFYDKSGGIMCNTNDNPFVVPEGTKYAVLLLRKSKNTTDEVVFKNIQVEEAISPTAYEPYHEPQSLYIQTPNGLPAISVETGGNYTDANGQQWVADYIDLKRGKYVQNIRILELTGQEPYIVAGTSYFSGSSANMYIVASDMQKDGAVMCNCLSEKPYVWSIKTAVGCTTNIQQIHLRFSKATIGVTDDASLEETKTVYKNYIKSCYEDGNPIEIHYILAEPIERDLTASEIQAYQNLVTYAGTTILENDAECYMEVSAGGGDALRAKKLALLLGD